MNRTSMKIQERRNWTFLHHSARGTSLVELCHKQLISNYGMWKIGTNFSDLILAVRNHRHNQRISASKRENYLKFGHHDSWLVDLLQTLILENQDACLHPDWPNTMEFSHANESFVKIALHDPNLNFIVENLSVN